MKFGDAMLKIYLAMAKKRLENLNALNGNLNEI